MKGMGVDLKMFVLLELEERVLAPKGQEQDLGQSSDTMKGQGSLLKKT